MYQSAVLIHPNMGFIAKVPCVALLDPVSYTHLDVYKRQALGVDIDSLLVSQPDTGEQALEICEALVLSLIHI